MSNKQTGFSPNFTRINTRISSELLNTPLTFKFLYFDIHNNQAQAETLVYPVTFRGDNVIINGPSNQISGSVFIGNFSPETIGDYASGTNHTLPTSGFARQYSGVNLDSFLKSITFQKITKNGIKNIGPYVELLADAEGLDAHKMSISLRLNEIQND